MTTGLGQRTVRKTKGRWREARMEQPRNWELLLFPFPRVGRLIQSCHFRLKWLDGARHLLLISLPVWQVDELHFNICHLIWLI